MPYRRLAPRGQCSLRSQSPAVSSLITTKLRCLLGSNWETRKGAKNPMPLSTGSGSGLSRQLESETPDPYDGLRWGIVTDPHSFTCDRQRSNAIGND